MPICHDTLETDFWKCAKSGITSPVTRSILGITNLVHLTLERIPHYCDYAWGNVTEATFTCLSMLIWLLLLTHIQHSTTCSIHHSHSPVQGARSSRCGLLQLGRICHTFTIKERWFQLAASCDRGQKVRNMGNQLIEREGWVHGSQVVTVVIAVIVVTAPYQCDHHGYSNLL